MTLQEKILEKERTGVYFILCTMSPEKIDKAINDSGQLYEFRELLSTDIANYLHKIILNNKYELTDEFEFDGINAISEFCHGSLRRGLSILERCIIGQVFSIKEIEKEFTLLANTNLQYYNRFLTLFNLLISISTTICISLYLEELNSTKNKNLYWEAFYTIIIITFINAIFVVLTFVPKTQKIIPLQKAICYFNFTVSHLS